MKVSCTSSHFGDKIFCLGLIAVMSCFISTVLADPYPPYWDGGLGGAVHYQPAPWPQEDDWISATHNHDPINDQRTADPSNGGTQPQNYVNVSSGCPDQNLPSIYWCYNSTFGIFYFRWRVEQIANTYATGPNPGSYGNADPWNAALWTVLIDLNGDGYRDFAMLLDGSNGKPATPVDRLLGIYATTLSQNIDFEADPANIHLLAHNPSAFVDRTTNIILNFQDALNPAPSWPNGNSETTWDYGTTRSRNVSAGGCIEYIIDYQIPMGFLDASSVGGPTVTATTPISLAFATANSLQNPLQKDVVYEGSFTSDVNGPIPFGDPITLGSGEIESPVALDTEVAGCGPAALGTNIMYSLDCSTTGCVPVVNVEFYYYYDRNNDGLPNDGFTWVWAASGSRDGTSCGHWIASWDSTSLQRGQYLIGVQVFDTATLNPDGKIRRTFSYLTQAEVDTMTPPETELWFANVSPEPGVTYSLFDNGCGTTPALITNLKAVPCHGEIAVTWDSAYEVGTLGYILKKFDSGSDDFFAVHPGLLVGCIDWPEGGSYCYLDSHNQKDVPPIYELIEVASTGVQTVYGPVEVQIADGISQQIPFDITDLGSAKFIKKPRNNPGVLTSRDTLSNSLPSKSGNSHNIPGLSNHNTLKIITADSGIYEIDAQTIASCLNNSVDNVIADISQHAYSLTRNDQPVAWEPLPENTGIFFYAENNANPYSDNSIYWLKPGSGVSMPQDQTVLTNKKFKTGYFEEILHFEQDNFAQTALFQNPENDFFLWDYIVAGDTGKSFILDIPDPAPGSVMTLKLNLLGATDTESNPDHHVSVRFNGTDIGDDTWNGRAAHEFFVELDTDMIEPVNTLEVSGILDQGAPYSVFFVDSIDLTYTRQTKAVQENLSLHNLITFPAVVSGFQSPKIMAFDVTDPSTPVRINGTVTFTPESNYRIAFNPRTANGVFYAVSMDGIRVPDSVTGVAVSSEKFEIPGAEYVVIAPEQFAMSATRLAEYRSDTGLVAAVFTLEEINDVFNHGYPGPDGISEFLNFAYYSWVMPPEHVVLIGKGTYDYRDIYGINDNLMPVKLIGTPHGLIASDNRYGDVAKHDGVPEIIVGRIPVVTASELDTYIDKIISYEASDGTWQDRVLLLADNPDRGGDFTAASETIASVIPETIDVRKIYLQDHTVSDARRAIQYEISNGVGLVNYIGHGGVDRLAAEGLITSSDCRNFNNIDRLPILNAMTCVSGNFAIPGYDSIAENLLLSDNGGAIAVWAPTGLCINEQSILLDLIAVTTLFNSEDISLGSWVKASLYEYATAEFEQRTIDNFQILGDPGLVIR
ncbi:hypothetical protein JW979_13615 [bacterium]|nr:hypothetical protein [candidate division CSSED10-310 bacterium]